MRNPESGVNQRLVPVFGPESVVPPLPVPVVPPEDPPPEPLVSELLPLEVPLDELLELSRSDERLPERDSSRSLRCFFFR